jgi:hypothetical protein
MRQTSARRRRRALAVIRLGEADEVLAAWESAVERLAGPGAPAGRRSHAQAQLRAARGWQAQAAQDLLEAE